MFTDYSLILDGSGKLYLGGFHLSIYEVVEKLRIDYIINCSHQNNFTNDYAFIQKNLNPYFSYDWLKWNDTLEFEINFDQTLPILDKINQMLLNGETVAVHCFAGASRSPTLVIMYLIKYHQMSLDQALTFLKEKRSCINPNDGFLKQLEIFSSKHLN